jgi:hypothetical protein|tara:strand:- start:542 stop:730 length:189 start_codon:yes stop_codon:yes gene_type:complete
LNTIPNISFESEENKKDFGKIIKGVQKQIRKKKEETINNKYFKTYLINRHIGALNKVVEYRK